MSQPIVDGQWPVIGKVAVPKELLVPPWFFKQDPISGKLAIGRTGTEERTPEPGQIETLERAAVWSAAHVVDRLRDYFDGRPNKWVESMRPKYSLVAADWSRSLPASNASEVSKNGRHAKGTPHAKESKK